MAREQVLTDLWPDADPEKSGARLGQCLRQIRERLDASSEDTMVADWVDERLRLDAGAVWSDVQAFEEALAEAGRAAEPAAHLRRAVDLYQGPFCEGHSYEWALHIRERFQRLFVDASGQLAELLAQEEHHDDALRVLDRAVEQDPFAEHLYRLAISSRARGIGRKPPGAAMRPSDGSSRRSWVRSPPGRPRLSIGACPGAEARRAVNDQPLPDLRCQCSGLGSCLAASPLPNSEGVASAPAQSGARPAR